MILMLELLLLLLAMVVLGLLQLVILCLFSGKQLENGAALPPAPVGRPGGALVLAVEYENNLHEYGSNLPCEFEFYMG